MCWPSSRYDKDNTTVVYIWCKVLVMLVTYKCNETARDLSGDERRSPVMLKDFRMETRGLLEAYLNLGSGLCTKVFEYR